MKYVFSFDRKTETELATRMNNGRVRFGTKNLNCLQTIYSGVFKGFEKVTSGCLTSSESVYRGVGCEIVVKARGR